MNAAAGAGSDPEEDAGSDPEEDDGSMPVEDACSSRDVADLRVREPIICSNTLFLPSSV